MTAVRSEHAATEKDAPIGDGETIDITVGEAVVVEGGEKKKAGRDASTGHVYKEDSNCIILTNENFDTTLVERGPLFIKFYDPHCNHCKQLMPAWEQIATEVNPEEGKAPMFPNRIACIDCVTNRAKCNEMPKFTGFPKFYLLGVDKQTMQADMLEFKGERKLEPLMKWAKEVGDIGEARKKQQEGEDSVKKARRSNWIQAEPFFENAAKVNNKKPGVKMITWGNFDTFFNATQAEDAPPNSQLLIVAHGSGYEDTKWWDAYEDLAHRVHKLNSEEVNIVVARVDCRNEMPRLCFDHPKYNFPERFDIFPIGLLFNKKFPDGDTDQKIHGKRTWQDMAKLFHNPKIEKMLEDAASSEQEMMDEL
jgi:thiol-disulfide isomerase/thioredoxin